MGTPFDEINTIFYNIIESDPDFFNYFGLNHVQSMNLAEQRADSCLVEAATDLAISNEADVDFSDFNFEERQFNFELNEKEKYLLARLQYQRYLYRDFATLRAQAMRFTSSEQEVFSPANDRKTFLNMYTAIKEENDILVSRYLEKDRNSGERKSLSYTDL